MLRAPISADIGLVTPSARDEFTQVVSGGSDPLTGLTAVIGGVWAGAGDADDFVVEDTGHTAQRTAVSDGGIGPQSGRLAISGVSAFAAQAVQVDFKTSAEAPRLGVIARYVALTDFLAVVVTPNVADPALVNVVKRVASANVELNGSGLTPLAPAVPVGAWFTIRVAVYASGVFAVWLFPRGARPGNPIVVGSHTDLATGGTLATGKPGFVDLHDESSVCTRTYNNFLAWVPSADAVLNASQSAELTTNGMYRQAALDDAYGPVSQVVGDLPRLPPTVEGRTTEIFVKVSRGDFDQLPDSGIDDLSVQVYYRPCWLTVPGS